MRYLLTAALLTIVLGASSTVAQDLRSAPPPGERACLRPAQIYDYHPVPGNRAIVVTDLARRQYRLTFMGTCRDLQYHIGLRFKTFGTGGLSCVARGDQIQMNDPVNPNPCIVQSVDYQTAALEQADVAAAAAARRR
ncbi:MAG TPA: DUF6491 family protein [Rhizomicrobium sp.]|jgi:hypothetical protein|nr:DUF6491 family protein [Rhizomicrobium sp.]